jgi:acyl-CoA synthetase (AMP-forming)/AMP-acid ligase II/MFS family permease/acyl carrier protein
MADPFDASGGPLDGAQAGPTKPPPGTLWPFSWMTLTYCLGVFNDNFFKYAITTTAAAIGLVYYPGWIFAVFITPYLLFAAPAGWLADRLAKRYVVIGAKVLEVLAMAAGAAGIITLSWPLLFAMAFLMGLQSCLFSPAMNGSIPELFPPAYVTRANSYLKGGMLVAVLVGIGLAGVLLDAYGRHGVAAGVLLVAIVGALTSLATPHRPAAEPTKPFPWAGPLRTLGDLWGLRKDPLLGRVVLLDAFIWATGQLQVQLINELVVGDLAWSKSLFSALVAIETIGIAAGGLVIGRVGRGDRWRHLVLPLLGIMAVLLGLVSLVPMLPGSWQFATFAILLGGGGVMGGMVLIPCEAFIQARPPSGAKGTVLAAAGFAFASALIASAGFGNALLATTGPAWGFLATGAVVILVGLWFTGRTRPVVDRLLVEAGKAILRLRYRVRMRGVRDVARGEKEGILLLPNHPALIDPVILAAWLHGSLKPVFLADETQVGRPVIRPLARRLGVREIPDVKADGASARQRVADQLDALAGDLRAGRNVVLYPSGHLQRGRYEDLRGNRAAHELAHSVPQARVVLVRTRGLWGSGFSWAAGREPRVAEVLWNGAKALLASFVFFAPKREVTVELHEPGDLPRGQGQRQAFNDALESWYNADAPPNTYVPRTPWEPGGVRELPEPPEPEPAGDLSDVPDATRQAVVDHLREVSGLEEIAPDDQLARDLGLDSLARVDLIAWLDEQWGQPGVDDSALRTVGDVMLAARGLAVARDVTGRLDAPQRWQGGRDDRPRVKPAEGETIGEVFARLARQLPDKPVVADATSGVKTLRDLAMAANLLGDRLAKLPGETLGIMLPASVGATATYLAALRAGKRPAMLNWTVGERNLRHCIDVAGLERVVTARRLIDRLQGQGVGLAPLEGRMVMLEDLAGEISLAAKLRAWLRIRLLGASWPGDLDGPDEPAVVLFTSGSETRPKAVPLTHANILANLRDTLEVIEVGTDDRLLGMLPPFHSFGLTVCVGTAICAGLRVVYHPDPTDAARLARIARAYRVTLLVGTPTFLRGIARAAGGEPLGDVRLAITGAEACPDAAYRELRDACPDATVVEGYGITECSPIVAVNRIEDPQPGTVGPPLPSFDWAIVDPETFEPVEQGRRGMLLVRGPSVFGGYLGDDAPEAYVEHAGSQWYRTGDLVREGERGALVFEGRLKRFVKIGGEMISLPAIESTLQQRLDGGDEAPDEASLAVTATEDDRPELVLWTTRKVTREQANAALREEGFSSLHHIRRVIVIDEIPLLGTGKIDHRSLRRRLAEDDGDGEGGENGEAG